MCGVDLEDALSGCFRATGSKRMELPIPNAPPSTAKPPQKSYRSVWNARGVGCEEWEAEIDGRVAALSRRR